MRHRNYLIALILIVAVAAAALVSCGDDDTDASGPSQSDGEDASSSDDGGGGGDGTPSDDDGSTPEADGDSQSEPSGDTDAADGGGEDGATDATDVVDGDPVLVGAVFSQSGPMAPFGEPGIAGLQLAAADLNSSGGIVVDGVRHLFEVVVRDDRGDPAAAAAAAQELVVDQGAPILATVGTASIAGAIMPIGIDAQAITLTPGTVAEALLADGAADEEALTLFRSLASGDVIYPALGPALLEFDPDIESVALIWPEGEVLSANEDFIRQGMEDNGIDLNVVAYPPETTDFASFISRAADSDPDIIFVSFIPGDAITMTRQAVELDAAGGFLGLNMPPSIPFEDAIGEPIDRPFYLMFPSRQPYEPTSQEAADYFASYEEVEGGLPALVHTSLWYYDYLFMVAEAMVNAGTIADTTAIASELASLTYSGVLGDVRFDSNHSPIHGMDFGLALDGDLNFIELDDVIADLTAGR